MAGFDPTAFAAFNQSQDSASSNFDPAKLAAIPAERSTMGDIGIEGSKGVGRGLAGFAGQMGEALAGPFGPSHHFGNLMADFRLRERPKDDPSYGEQLTHAAGLQAAPQTTAGKYASSIGETLGNPVTYAGPGGLAAKTIMGAASGAGSEAAGELTEDTSLEGPARFAGSLIGGPLAGRMIKPQMTPAAQRLADEGVRGMTPGQMFGGQFKDVEDKAGSLPFAGGFIKASRERAMESFNKSVANQALAPIGERLARGTRAGHDLVDEVESKLSDRYDQLVPNLHFQLDRPFAQDMSKIYRDVDTLPAENARQFHQIIENHLNAPGRWIHQINPPGTSPQQTISFQGQTVKDIESELGQYARDYGSSSTTGERLLGRQIGEVVKAMRTGLERSNPAYAQELKQINTGWAMYARIRDAAGNRRTGAGFFTPSDLLAGVKRGDKSAGKGSFAKGDAMLQRSAEAGQEALPSKVPDSGTAGRALMAGLGLHHLGYLSNPKVWGAIAGSAAAYNPLALGALNRLARPTTGARAAYSAAGRGFGTVKPFFNTPYGNMDRLYVSPMTNPNNQ